MCRLPFRFGDMASERSASGRSASDRIVRIGTWQQSCESGEAEAVRPLGGAARRLTRCEATVGRFRVTGVDDDPASRLRAGAGEGSVTPGRTRSCDPFLLADGLDGDGEGGEGEILAGFAVKAPKHNCPKLAAALAFLHHRAETLDRVDRRRVDDGLSGRSNGFACGDPNRGRSAASDGLCSPDGGSGCLVVGSGATDGSGCDIALDGRRDHATDGRGIAGGRLLFRAIVTDDGVASCALHTSVRGIHGDIRLSLIIRHGVARN